MAATPLPSYPVRRAPAGLATPAGWGHPFWAAAETLELACFRPEGSNHRPRTRARLLWGDRALHGIFRVEDRHVRCVHNRFGDPVYRDSCVELFLDPRPGRGYLNFEWNAGGALLASHVRDPERTPAGLRDATPLAEAEGRRVAVAPSLPPVIDPELPGPLTWTLAFALPLDLLEARVGPLGPLPGQRWRANLYKCGDATSHPHWASWAPLAARNFHLPECFGVLAFEG